MIILFIDQAINSVKQSISCSQSSINRAVAVPLTLPSIDSFVHRPIIHHPPYRSWKRNAYLSFLQIDLLQPINPSESLTHLSIHRKYIIYQTRNSSSQRPRVDLFETMTDNTQNDSWDDSLNVAVLDSPGPNHDYETAGSFILGLEDPWTLKILHHKFIVHNNFHRFRALRQLDLSMCELEAIPDWAFLNCTDLQQVKLPASLRQIDSHAFENAALTGVLDLESCTTLTLLGAGAFKNCKSLERVKLPPTARL